MSLGISTIGPRKLPYLQGQDRSRQTFRFSKIEFETKQGVEHGVRLPYGVVLEIPLADHIMVIGLARDLVSPQEIDYVDLENWGEYFEDCSTRDGIKRHLDSLVGIDGAGLRPGTSYLEVLEEKLPPPFYQHLPEQVDICWIHDAHLFATMPYAAARSRVRALLERFAREPFLSFTDLPTTIRRLRAVR